MSDSALISRCKEVIAQGSCDRFCEQQDVSCSCEDEAKTIVHMCATHYASGTAGKIASYLTQENSVLHERVRRLEIALAKETEACARVADVLGTDRSVLEKIRDDEVSVTEAASATAKHIAILIRGRGET